MKNEFQKSLHNCNKPLVLSCNNDDYAYAEVPFVIVNQFWSQYPDATDAVFLRMDKKNEVDFEINRVEDSALMNSSGNILQEMKEIKWNELPPAVQQTL